MVLGVSERRLSGTGLKIYVYLLESGEPRTVREIAEALGIPHSSVHYHLKKLMSMGVVRRVREGYVIGDRINIEGYIILKNKLIPRLMIYSLFFFGLFLGELLVLAFDPRIYFERILLLIVSFVAFIILFYEGLHMHLI